MASFEKGDEPASQRITIIIHHEHGTWWTETEGLPGLHAVADTRGEAVDMTRELILDDERVIDDPVVIVVDADGVSEGA